MTFSDVIFTVQIRVKICQKCSGGRVRRTRELKRWGRERCGVFFILLLLF